jgi:hypothetical protein
MITHQPFPNRISWLDMKQDELITPTAKVSD